VKVEPKEQAVYVGSNVLIICISNYTVVWIAHSKIIESDETIGHKNFLIINEANEKDSGEYTCIADVEDEQEENFMDISVLYVGSKHR